MVTTVCRKLGVSERRACRVLDQPRSTQRHVPKVREDEPMLTRRIVELASEYGRYGYRRITAMLWREGWRWTDEHGQRVRYADYMSLGGYVQLYVHHHGSKSLRIEDVLGHDQAVGLAGHSVMPFAVKDGMLHFPNRRPFLAVFDLKSLPFLFTEGR